MNKVIQLGFLGHDNGRRNPNRGRLYWPKGISPCLNSCTGGQREPLLLLILPIESKAQTNRHTPIPTDRRQTVKLTNLIQDGKYYDLRHAIYWTKGCSPALTAAMGMGGGFVPLFFSVRKIK